MKTKTTIFVLLFLFAAFFAGCTHTNELAKFNLKASKVFFKNYVSPSAGRVRVDLHAGYGTDAKSLVKIILAETGAEIIESSIEEKLKRAVNTDSLVEYISDGIIGGLITYYTIDISEELEPDTRFIAETKLLGFKLVSNSGGIYADVSTEVTITDRNTAKIVWENRESSSIPLYDVVIDVFGSGTIRTTTSVINAIRLMNMSEDEIRVMISNASEEAGRKQSETLREDIASGHN